ncbi:hypothetical protein C2845_PM01G44930 [Panicum miliaceum]|uniref:Uncharacterized protein n=1 Tax=Panicum miliaceum TaxID=4540 RepID=A0A3L6TVB2_PANMI|nr:hypothetical protein C2845_PM01G44930 [Panicum miliaceum]
MKSMGQKLSGALKKLMGASSSCSRGGSSSHHSSEPTLTPSMMDYKEQGEQEEVQAEVQAEDMEIDEEDSPYIYLRSDRERQAYAILKH